MSTVNPEHRSDIRRTGYRVMTPRSNARVAGLLESGKNS